MKVKSSSAGMRGVSVSNCKIGDNGTLLYSVYGIRLIDFQGGKGYATVTGNVISIQAQELARKEYPTKPVPTTHFMSLQLGMWLVANIHRPAIVPIL